MSDDPKATLPAVEEMREDWAVIGPLIGGTRAMREAGKALLPQFPAEDDATYKSRLSLSTLLPAYSETVSNSTSRVFAEPIQIGDDVPPNIVEMVRDIDQAGNDLNAWCVDWFYRGLSYGLCHALVEYPKAADKDGKPLHRTVAQEKAAGVRPYAVIVRPEQVLGWRQQGGKLVQIRYLESVEVPDGVYGTKSVEQVRILEPGSWVTLRVPESGGAWAEHERGVTSLSYIPFVTFYTGRTGFMTARPPLIELAHINVKHWQSQSDQDNLLHVARVPLLFTFTDDEMFKLTISSGSATRMPKDGSAKYVEHTGAAIGAGRTALQDMIVEMRLAGAKLTQQDKQATMTATQASEEAAQDLSPLARMAGHFADCVAQLLQCFADYTGQADGGTVEVRGNFEQDYAPEVSLPQLVALANAGKLSDKTLFSEFQRRKVISDEHDWESEKERLEEQGPALGAM